MTEAEEAPPGVDTSTPSAARLYDYYLGGTNNFPVDQAAGDQLKAALPDLYDAAWANRGFHQRSAIWMAKERGIRQFIDIGSGLPTQGNTHQAVKKAIADPLVVYVDKDPMVRAMADGLLADERRTRLVVADMRDPGEVLGNPELRSLIDFSQPVGLLMTAVLHFVADGSDPWRQGVGVPLDQAPRVGTVGDEVQHGGHQQPHRLTEVDQGPQLRVAEHLAGIAHVGDDEPGPPFVGEQPVGHGPHHRVLVHVQDQRVGDRLLDGLMRVALGRQTRSDVDELADAAFLGHPDGRALMEAAVGPGGVVEIRQRGLELVARGLIHRKVVGTAEVVVVQPGGARCGRVHSWWRLLCLGHQLTLQRWHRSQFGTPRETRKTHWE